MKADDNQPCIAGVCQLDDFLGRLADEDDRFGVMSSVDRREERAEPLLRLGPACVLCPG
jgi:hypothetical protein